MSNEIVTVRNLVTRKVGQVRRRIAEHDVLGKNLEIVPDGTKSFVSLDDLVKTHQGREPETVDDLVKLEDLENIYDEKEDEA